MDWLLAWSGFFWGGGGYSYGRVWLMAKTHWYILVLCCCCSEDRLMNLVSSPAWPSGAELE